MFADMRQVEPESPGTIKCFYGALGDIPKGWALCDGTNGTPDMQNKFIFGAGDGVDCGEYGGSPSHSHTGTFASHSHALAGVPNAQEGYDVYASPYTNTQAKSGDIAVVGEFTLPPYIGLYYIMKL